MRTKSPPRQINATAAMEAVEYHVNGYEFTDGASLRDFDFFVRSYWLPATLSFAIVKMAPAIKLLPEEFRKEHAHIHWDMLIRLAGRLQGRGDEVGLRALWDARDEFRKIAHVFDGIWRTKHAQQAINS
jgi:uncharacterized protein with HEPN domain